MHDHTVICKYGILALNRPELNSTTWRSRSQHKVMYSMRNISFTQKHFGRADINGIRDLRNIFRSVCFFLALNRRTKARLGCGRKTCHLQAHDPRNRNTYCSFISSPLIGGMLAVSVGSMRAWALPHWVTVGRALMKDDGLFSVLVTTLGDVWNDV